jgi:hypothetical protein
LINKPLYFKLLFYIAGTLLLVGMFSVVGINMAKDSKFFNNEKIAQVNTSVNPGETVPEKSFILFRQTDTPRPSQNPVTVPPLTTLEPTAAGPTATLKTTVVKTTPKPSASVTPKPTATPVFKSLNIEVINQSGVDYSGTYVVDSLNSIGHNAVLSGSNGTTTGNTQIIIRKVGVDVTDIKSALVVGLISADFIPGYNYDVTIILGTDFIP